MQLKDRVTAVTAAGGGARQGGGSRPLALDTSPGPELARAVWQTVAAIPPGRVASYGEIARIAGFPRHARSVGRLMGRLPAGSKLPWWRVLRSDGRPGLTGSAAEEQAERLRGEGVSVLSGRVDLRRFGWRG